MAADPSPPDFVLRLVEGRGLLGLRSSASLPIGRLERLELEVPKLRFPFDGSGDAARFRNRRCVVRDALVRIDEEQLTAWIESRPLARYGLSELRARITDDHIQLAGTITIGDVRSPFTCVARLVATAGASAKLSVELDALCTYRTLPAPAPLVGLALLYAFGARPESERSIEQPPGFALRGIDAMEADALTVALWRSLLPWGWRLPQTDTLDPPRIESDGRTITIIFASASEVTAPTVLDSRALDAIDPHRVTLRQGDERLAANDLAGALAIYEALDDIRARERRVATLAVIPERRDEALALGAAVIGEAPHRSVALTLVASLLSEAAEGGRASELFQRAAVLAERSGEPAAAIEAALRAAELLVTVDPTAATPLLERVIAGRPNHARAGELLAERYAAEGRVQDLLRLEKRRLSYARGQREEAAARLRLGRVWLEHNDDALRARDELERALRLFAGDAETFRLYARTLDRAGEIDRAVDAADQAIGAPDANDTSRRADRLLAAGLAERAGKPALARRYVEDLLEEAPGDSPGLQLLARLAIGAGQLDEAFRAYERAAATAEDDAGRAQLYFELAQLCIRQGAPERARLYFDRAQEARPTLEILRAAAEHAEHERRLDDLESLLGRLGELGDRAARVRRARLLIELDRATEAANEAESLATLGDPEALAILVDARRAEDRPELLATALDRLVEASRDAAPRIELARVRTSDGDLVRARILLEEALAVLGEDQPLPTRDALEILCDVLLRQGDDASLEAALGRLAVLREDPASRALALGAQGAARARLGRLDASLTSYRAAIAADDTDTQARLGLAETAYVLRLWDEARTALEPVFTAAPRADRALRLGEIAERQGRPPDAIQFYEAALAAGATGADAQRIYGALAQLHHERADWEAEARILLRAAEDGRTTDSNPARAGRLVQAADLLRKRVARIDDALPLYDRALALDPVCLPALDALESIALEREDWARAAQILSRKVAATSKRPSEQRAILGRLAVIQAEHLGREDAAREAYTRALAIDPGFRPALVFLAREARSRGARGEERDRLERLSSLPADPTDPESRLVDLLRLGQLYLEDGRESEAEGAARRVLSEQPRNANALALLDEVFSRGGRNAELEAILAVRAQIEPDHDVGVELLSRRASLLEAAGRLSDAISAYEHVTSLRPNHAVGWSRLADLLRRAQSWTPLAAALGRLADWHGSAGRREEAAALYVEQAHVLHDQLSQPNAARIVLERAREVWPGSRLVVGALLALARGRGDEADEAALLDQLVELEADPAARTNAIVDRARTLVQRGEREEALRRLREVPVDQAPAGALRPRIELEEALGSLASALDALERLRDLAEAAHDHTLERYALVRLLRVAREQAPSRTEAVATRLAVLDPDDRDALRGLADAAAERGDTRTRTQLLDRLLEATRRHADGPEREAAIAVELAELAREAGDLRTAELRLREAAEAAPSASTRRALGLVLLQRGNDHDATAQLAIAAELGVLSPADLLALADAYERLGQEQRAATAVLGAGTAAPHTRRAVAAARLGDDQLARASALEALRGDAADDVALAVLLRGLSAPALIAQLEELAPQLGPERAAVLLEQRGTTLPPESGRFALERALALAPTAARWLAYARLSKGAAASEAYASALTIEPGSVDAAMGHAELVSAEDGLPILRAALVAQGVARTDPRALVDRARLTLRIGELERDRGELAAARSAFADALDEASSALGQVDGESERLINELRVRAARALAQAARVAGDAEAAELALGAIVDAGAASDADLRMLAELLMEREATSDAIEILEGLRAPGELYAVALERASAWPRLTAHLTRDAAGRPPAQARALLLRAAALSIEHLEDPARAVMLFERALPLGPVDAEIWERIGTLRRDRLGDRTGAAHALARAYGADATRTHLLLSLADFHHESGELAPAHDYYATLLASGSAPADALPRIHLRLAQYARAEADALEEERHLRAAVALGPSDDAWRRLIELYRIREDKLRLEQALLALADLVPPEERLVLLREARTLEGPAPMPELDERILALDRNDAEARVRVLERLRRAEDPSALLDRLEREIETALHESGGAVGPELPLELGRVSQERGDHARAARGFRLAAEHGGGRPAAEGAVQALRALGRQAEAAGLLETMLAGGPSDDTRVALEHLLLALYLEIAPQRALPLVEAARHRGVELTLDAADYRRLLHAEGRFELLLTELDRAAHDAADADRAALCIQAAELLEGPMQRPHDAAQRYAALFEAAPQRRELAARARSLYAAAGEPIYALALLDQELAIATPEELPQLKITRGELLLAAGADAEAEGEFLHALITTKRVGRAHAALADVYRKRGDLASALEHLIAAADAPDLEPARAAACAVDAADVLLIEGDTATAERLYQLAAALDPADRRAIDALIRLAAAQDAFDRQAELLGRAAALTADRRERARLLHQRARIYETSLGRDLDAYRAYREAVACDPSLREAVHALRSLAEARGEWAVAAEQLYREAALAETPRERARLHVRLAQIHEERLFDSTAALRSLEQAGELLGEGHLADDAENPWPALVRLYAESQRFVDAAEAADRAVRALPEEATTQQRTEALGRAANMWARAGDAERAEARRTEAARLEERSLGFDDIPSDAAPDVQRSAIEARLRTEPEGERRIALLRRLVSLLDAHDDLTELDARATELLQRAPDDAAAFLARRRVLEARRDPAALAALLRNRALLTSDPHERAERRYEAGRVAEGQLYDVVAAATDYEAALGAEPDHVPSLDALADLSFRTRHLQRARVLYERLGDRAVSLGADEVARRRGELAEEAGDHEAARHAYQLAIHHNQTDLAAQQALARVAMHLSDDRGAFSALRSVLDLLPRDALDRAAELRRHLGELAMRLGELAEARGLLEAVLLDDPRRRDVLATLTEVYEREGAWQKAADLYARRTLLTERADERADLLFRQGEALSQAGDRESASDAFLKAADLNPRHAPTLRRLLRHYLGMGDLEAIVELIAELEALGAPLAEAALDAALGLALRGDEARGTIIAALAQPSPAAIADAFGALSWPPPPRFDAALRTAERAAGGGAQARERLVPALEARAKQAGGLCPRLALAMLLEQGGQLARARVHLELISFIAPTPSVDARIATLGVPSLPEPSIDQVVAPAARGPLRDVLCDLGPLVLGLAVAPLDVEPTTEATQRIAPVASLFGYPKVEVVLLDRLADPAWAEPTRPPRLLLQRRFSDDPRASRFAAARALHALHAGLGLIHGRSAEDVGALLRGAAALFLPDLRTDGPFVRAWQAELLSIGLRPDALPEPVRMRLEVGLANLLVDRNAGANAPAYAAAERLTANRVAYVVTADIRAGLAALCPIGATDPAARERVLNDDPAIADLLAFALLLAG